MKNGLPRWGLVILWMIVIFIGSSIGNLPTFDNGPIDRGLHWSAHLFEYAVFACLLLRALPDRSAGWHGVALVLIVIALYGLSDEFHQRFVAGRSSDVTTVLLDELGGLIGTALWWRRQRANDSASQQIGE